MVLLIVLTVVLSMVYYQCKDVDEQEYIPKYDESYYNSNEGF